MDNGGILNKYPSWPDPSPSSCQFVILAPSSCSSSNSSSSPDPCPIPCTHTTSSHPSTHLKGSWPLPSATARGILLRGAGSPVVKRAPDDGGGWLLSHQSRARGARHLPGQAPLESPVSIPRPAAALRGLVFLFSFFFYLEVRLWHRGVSFPNCGNLNSTTNTRICA
jgi:hypothetical protein